MEDRRLDSLAEGAEDSPAVAEGAEVSAGASALNFLFLKESSAKKTSMKINLEVNSKLFFDKDFFTNVAIKKNMC